MSEFGDMWKCPACGMDNSRQWNECVECNTPRPAENLAAPPKLAANQWLCPHCNIPVSWGAKCPKCGQEETAAMNWARASANMVTIVDINIPWFRLTGFLIKLALAAVPAAIIVGILYALAAGLLSALFMATR